MSKVDCKNCQFYHNGRCEELGEYTTPGEGECSWFAPKAIKKSCVAEIAKNAKQTVFHRITQSPEVLAEKLVYCVPIPLFEYGAGLERWYTVFSPYNVREYFRTKQEAIAAAVAKLKEVAE